MYAARVRRVGWLNKDCAVCVRRAPPSGTEHTLSAGAHARAKTNATEPPSGRREGAEGVNWRTGTNRTGNEWERPVRILVRSRFRAGGGASCTRQPPPTERGPHGGVGVGGGGGRTRFDRWRRRWWRELGQLAVSAPPLPSLNGGDGGRIDGGRGTVRFLLRRIGVHACTRARDVRPSWNRERETSDSNETGRIRPPKFRVMRFR